MPVIIICILLVFCLQPNIVDDQAINSAPSFSHFFGTDLLGRDVWSRTLIGTIYSIIIMIVALMIALLIGFAVGLLSGLAPKRFGDVLMVVVDFINSLPSIIYVLLLVSIITPTFFTLPIIIGCCSWMAIARQVRMALLKERHDLAVMMAKQLGTSKMYRIKRYYAQALLPVVVVTAIQEALHILFTETTLSFLGFGLPLNIPTLGNLLIDAQQYFLLGAWWNIIFPGIFLAMISIVLLQIQQFLRRGEGDNAFYQRCIRLLQWPFGRRQCIAQHSERRESRFNRKKWGW